MNSILRILFCLFVTSLCSWSQDVSRPSEVLKGISDDVLKELRQHRPGEPAPQAAIDKANQQMETYCRGKSGVLYSKDTENQGERKVRLLQVILDHELKIHLSTVCSQIEQTGVKYWSRIDLRQKVNSN